MKTTNLILFLVSLLVVGVVSLSCDDSTNRNENTSKTLSAKDVANIHNEVLTSFYHQNQLRASIQSLKFSDIHNNVVNILKENHADFFVDVKQEISIDPVFVNVVSRSSLRSSNGSVDILSLIIDESFNNLVNTNVYSSSFIADMKKIVTTDNDFIVDDLQTYAEENELTKEERLFIKVFIEVYNASDNYWNNQHKIENQLRWSKSSTVMAADAVGAVLGLYGGPAWSIIQGAIVSIAFNEDPLSIKVEDDPILTQFPVELVVSTALFSYEWEY